MQKNQRPVKKSPMPNSMVDELAGYVELGLKPQALRIVRKILARRVIEPQEFTQAINTLGMMTNLRTWIGA